LINHLADLERAAAQNPPPSAVEDVTVLREKYQTANRHIQFGDEQVQWIGRRTQLAIQDPRQPDVGVVAEGIRLALEENIKPGPSWELIQRDLQASAQALGQPYTAAQYAWCHLQDEAWKAVVAEGTRPDFDSNRTKAILAVAMWAGSEYLSVSLLPAK